MRACVLAAERPMAIGIPFRYPPAATSRINLGAASEGSVHLEKRQKIPFVDDAHPEQQVHSVASPRGSLE